MAALLPRPTRTDAWIALALLFLSLGSTLVLERDALVALTAGLPTAPVPHTTAVFVWVWLAPSIPVMVLGQVWLYRMTRRPATEPTFFA